MKKNIKILSMVIVLIIMMFSVLSLNAYATLTPADPIPIGGDINDDNTTPVITNNDNTNTNTNTNTNNEVVALNDEIAEDKVAEDKVLPDAGFDTNMLYIISALIIFAVFAYIKVVKYNVD